MSDCDCEKKKIDETWLDKNDYGDEFLREESFKIITRILRDKEYYSINNDAVFNIKFDENDINDMSLEDVNVDYSYLKNRNFKGLNNDLDEIELLEETENMSDSTESILSQEEAEEMEKIQNIDTIDENILDDILDEETDREENTISNQNYFSSMTEDDEELQDIVSSLPKVKQNKASIEKNVMIYETNVPESKLDEILEEDY